MHSNRPALLSAPIFPWQGTARIPGTGRFPKRRVCPCAGTGQTERTDREAVHPVPKIEITPVRNHADRGEIVKERLVGLLPYYHVGKSSDNSQHVSARIDAQRRLGIASFQLYPVIFTYSISSTRYDAYCDPAMAVLTASGSSESLTSHSVFTHRPAPSKQTLFSLPSW